MSDALENAPEVAREDVAREIASEVREEHVLRVRLGHGANCSSVGSVIDTLFLGATLGGVVFAAVCAAMKVETITVVGKHPGAVPAEPEDDAP